MSPTLSRRLALPDHPAGFDTCEEAPDVQAVFRLGMPHLNGTGVSLTWLLKECAHRHWWSLSGWLGQRPGDLRDLTGARIMASVVAATVQGNGEGFSEDDLARIDTEIAPRPASGWRGVFSLKSASGARMVVELITSFARREGSSNTALAAAALPAELRAARSGSGASRANVLRRNGRSLRAAPWSTEDPCHASVEIFGPTHFNGVGLTYFANFSDMFERAEHASIPPLKPRLPVVAREIHYFGNIDEGDVLDISSRATAKGIAPKPLIEVLSAARRRSDNSVIAICLSERRAL